jgi:peptide/nickel transport system permease protein
MIYYTASFLPAEKRAELFIPPKSYHHPGFDVWAQLPKIIEKYHLKDPFYVQYLNWLRFVFTEGSLGFSYLHGKMVLDVIVSNLSPTLELVMYSAPIIIFGGIKLGVYSAKRDHEKKGREDPLDFIIRAVTTLGYSVPIFFTGILLISIFFLNLHWITLGRLGSEAEFFIYSENWNFYTGLYTIDALLNGQFWIFLDALKHLALPIATLTISIMPIIIKVTRSSILVELGQQYIVAAKAKGLQDVEVVSRAKRNAMISIITISSTLFASMLTGVVVTEYIFSIGGIGVLAINAAKRYDFVLLIGISIFFCIIFVIINLIVDILYTYIDPRIKL